MKKGVILLLLIIFMAGAVLAIENESQTRVFVKFVESDSSDMSIMSAGDVKEIIKEELDVKHDFGDIISVVVSDSELAELEKNPLIESIEEVGMKYISLAQSVPLINATTSWVQEVNGANLTGAGQTVCVLDTGVDFTHPDLVGKNFTCMIDCTGSSCVEDCSEQDTNGHGTHVAGTIAANGLVRGVAIDTMIVGVKVCPTDSCPDDEVLAGMDWCINNAEAYNISVISMSLGGDDLYSSYCDDVSKESQDRDRVNNAVAKNISVVVAAGNDGSTTGISSPACLRNSTSVGMTYDANVGGLVWGGGFCTDSSTFADKVVCASNRNAITDLFAPGAMIYSTNVSGTYDTKGGTSMATPHVSGAIAILKQYVKAEQNRSLTPAEAEAVLISTGVEIDDSAGSEINYSRIDIYSAILALDETAPAIELVAPINNKVVSPNTFVNFSCIANDSLQLKNLTFYLWNSTGVLINETGIDATSNLAELNLSINLTNDHYDWNCRAYDEQNNSASFATNYSVLADEVVVVLESPENNYYTINNESNFTCTSSIGNNHNLSNVTFYLWNSSNELIHSELKNISGILNSSTFNYSNFSEGDYLWNCLAYDEFSNSNFAYSNNTFGVDTTNPNLSVISPLDGASKTGAGNIDFSYNVTESNIANCSLIVNDLIVLTNDSIISVENTFTKSFDVGSFSWSIGCVDLAGNAVNSSSYTYTVNSVPTSSGGGSSSRAISEAKMEEGITQYIRKGKKVEFYSNNKKHSLKVDDILEDSVVVTIQSDPIILTLKTNQTQKVDLDSDKIYDLEVVLNKIGKSSAEISMKNIEEAIPIRHISTEPKENIEEVVPELEEEAPIAIDAFQLNVWRVLAILVVILMILFVVLNIVRKRVKESRVTMGAQISKVGQIKRRRKKRL